jgi:hypothetical protein
MGRNNVHFFKKVRFLVIEWMGIDIPRKESGVTRMKILER